MNSQKFLKKYYRGVSAISTLLLNFALRLQWCAVRNSHGTSYDSVQIISYNNSIQINVVIKCDPSLS